MLETGTSKVVKMNSVALLAANRQPPPKARRSFGDNSTSSMVAIFGAFFENDENWPQAVLNGANRMHFDSSLSDVANVAKAQAEWDRLQRSTTQALRSIKSAGGVNKELQLLGSWRFHTEFAEAIGLLATEIDPEPLISHEFPLTEALRAFETASDRTAACKVLLRINEEVR